MFIIEKLWYCPLENRDPIYWKTIGYVTTEEEAQRIQNLEVIENSSCPYPLETYYGKGKSTPRYRVKKGTNICLDGLSLEDLKVLK